MLGSHPGLCLHPLSPLLLAQPCVLPLSLFSESVTRPGLQAGAGARPGLPSPHRGGMLGAVPGMCLWPLAL